MKAQEAVEAQLQSFSTSVKVRDEWFLSRRDSPTPDTSEGCPLNSALGGPQ